MIWVEPYQSQHQQAFLTLYRECLQHYKVPAATPRTETRILDLLARQQHMSCHLAFNDNNPAGFATWGYAFPSGDGISLVMKELFVSDTARGQGAGKALLSALLVQAKSEGCTRMDWATDGTNQNSQAFYDRIGMPVLQKKSYRISSKDFNQFISALG